MARLKKSPEHKSTGSVKSAVAAPRTRGPGRPRASEKGGASRQAILQAALKLSKTVPMQDLSIVMVARSIDVTPALIHYYIGGRDWLTSGIMNLFYKTLLRKWPAETGDWQEDVIAAARTIFDNLVTYPGIAAYLAMNNQFRIFQLTAFGDRDFGVEVLERLTSRVREAGLSPDRTGVYVHLITEFVISTAHRTSHKLFPSEHRQFLEDKVAQIGPDKWPNITFAKGTPLELDGDKVFQEGINLFLLGIQRDRAREGVADEDGAAKLASRGRKAGRSLK